MIERLERALACRRELRRMNVKQIGDDGFEVYTQGLSVAFKFYPGPCRCGNIKSGVGFEVGTRGPWAVPLDELEAMLDAAHTIRKQPTMKERIAALEAELENFKVECRKAVADYMASEGCSCCRDTVAHPIHSRRLAELLDVPKYGDDSGYNFVLFRSLSK